MKKLFVLSLLATVFMTCGLQLNAASWRVNNNTASGADFVDVNAAINDERVAAGDTLYLDPGTILTTKQNIYKRVTIVGPGYQHQGKPVMGAIISKGLEIHAAGTKIEGCIFREFDYQVYLWTDNVTFERNYFDKVGLSAVNSRNYIILHANYIKSTNMAITGGGSIGWVITNNIIDSGLTGIVYQGGSAIENLKNSTITNNVIICNDNDASCIYNVHNSVITNNILINYHTAKYGDVSSSSLNVIENNVTSSSSADFDWVNFPNNTFLGSNDLTAVFDTTGIADRYYRLCEGSPAKGAGVGGIDCGAYAADSYVPSGLPLYYPYFTNAVIPNVTTDGKLNIKLNIKVQNE